MTQEEQWIKESIENYIFAYTGKRAKISDADAQHFTASVMSYLNLCAPPLPSDLDEAAEEYGRKEYSHAIHFWDEGLSKNKPEVMKKDFVDSFKAGAEWQKEQMKKEAVEGTVCKQRDSTKATWIELIPDSLPAFDDCEPVKCIILKDDDLQP